MNLVLSENEITTFSNFHNKDEITTKFNTVNGYLSNKVSLDLLTNILDDYDNTITVNSKISSGISSTTLGSTLTNYLGFDLPRTTTTIKSISMSGWNLLKFEDGSTPIMIIDRVNSWGYTANTVIASNLGSLQNIWCAKNMYLRSNSKLYLNDLETEYLTTAQLLNVSGSTSNLQSQINNKMNSSDAFTSTTINSLLSNSSNAWTSGFVTSPYHFIETGTDALVIRSNNEVYAQVLSKRNLPDDGKLFFKDLEVDGTASLNTIYSRFNDNVLINDNLIITGNITLGGTSFNQKVDDAISSTTIFNSKLDVGSTLAGGEAGKSISIDIINPISGSTFQGGNKIWLNAQEVQCPYRFSVTDLIYTGDIYNFNTPIGTVISDNVNSKLVNTVKYDTIRSDSLNKVVNLSGLSSLSFDTYHSTDGAYKKDFFYDISNSGSYTRNSVFARYLRSNNLWVEGNLRMNPGTLILDNPLNLSSITTTNLSYLTNSSSNLQEQLDLKQPKFLYAARISASGSVITTTGRLTVTSAMISIPAIGDYVFTLPTPHPSGANFLVMVSPCSSAGTVAICTAFANTSTQFTVNVYGTAGVPLNSPFCFHTVP